MEFEFDGSLMICMLLVGEVGVHGTCRDDAENVKFFDVFFERE